MKKMAMNNRTGFFKWLVIINTQRLGLGHLKTGLSLLSQQYASKKKRHNTAYNYLQISFILIFLPIHNFTNFQPIPQLGYFPLDCKQTKQTIKNQQLSFSSLGDCSIILINL